MEQKHANYGLGMSVIGSIFFIFGFATTFIITLSGKVKDIFELTEFRAQLLNFAFFITYFFISIPIGLYIKKIGYKSALIIGLLLMAAGSFLFFPAAKIVSFELFLGATFVLASGVVFLQTAANPYVTALGPEESAGGRLNLTQALNSIATMIAPWIIATFIFRGTSQMLDSAQRLKLFRCLSL
jgi:FHS family L-fucose permease-like MFS transporter